MEKIFPAKMVVQHGNRQLGKVLYFAERVEELDAYTDTVAEYKLVRTYKVGQQAAASSPGGS